MKVPKMVWYHQVSARTFSYQPAIPLMRLKCEKEKSGGSFHCGRLVHPNSPAYLITDSPTSVGNWWSQPTHALNIGRRDRCEILLSHSPGAAWLSLITRKLNRPEISHVTGGDHSKCEPSPDLPSSTAAVSVRVDFVASSRFVHSSDGQRFPNL